MTNQTRLVRRGAMYHLRVKIPADLRNALRQKWEITKSLGTKDRREAERLARVESTRLDNEFQRLRAERKATLRPHISGEETKRLVALSVSTRMQADEEGRIAGLSDWEFERATEWLREAEQAGRTAVARGVFSGFESQIDDWLTGHGFELNTSARRR